MIYAHAMLAGGTCLILISPSPVAALAGGALLAAMVTMIAIAVGAVMGSRLVRDETPLPPVADIERQLSGGDPELSDEIQDQLDLMKQMDDPAAMSSSYSMTAPESRRQ